MPLAEVALFVPGPPQTRSILSYAVPDTLADRLRVGHLVWVPLRRKTVQGLVVALFEHAERVNQEAREPESQDTTQPEVVTVSFYEDEEATIEFRPITALAEPEICVPESSLALARWMMANLQSAAHEIYPLFVPGGASSTADSMQRATPEGLAVDLGLFPRREREILYYLRSHGPTRQRELERLLRGSPIATQRALQQLARSLVSEERVVLDPLTRARSERQIRLAVTPEEAHTQAEALSSGAARQRRLLEWLAGQDDPRRFVALREVVAATKATHDVIDALVGRGLLLERSIVVEEEPASVAPDQTTMLTLQQRNAWDMLRRLLEHGENEPQAMLLVGPLAQSRSELYLRAAARVLRQGRSVLVLAPRLESVVVLAERFAARFPAETAVWHSGLAQRARFAVWQRIADGQARIVVGTPLALFTPLAAPGLIVLEDEDDPSYKRDLAAPRYHAHDLAIARAAEQPTVLVYGSAVPSLEHWAEAQHGDLALAEIRERALPVERQGIMHLNTAIAPEVIIVDLRAEPFGGQTLSARALGLLEETIERGERALVIAQRRGGASGLVCRSCGTRVECPRCGMPLTWHYADEQTEGRRGMLACHSCGHREPHPLFCSVCLNPGLRPFGIGMQMVVSELRQHFSQARMQVWQSAMKRSEERAIETALREGSFDIAVGPRALLDMPFLPRSSLVIIADADYGALTPDFRSSERLFRLLNHATGQATLAETQVRGRVLVQSFMPDHYALRCGQEYDYTGFAREELAFRRRVGYPPFSRLVRFVARGYYDADAQRRIEALAERVRPLLPAYPGSSLIGPAPAYYRRLRGQWRWHLLLRLPAEISLAQIRALLDPLAPHGCVVDVDPISVL